MLRFGITPLKVEKIIAVLKQQIDVGKTLDFSFSDMVLEAAERGYCHCELTLDLFQILPIPLNIKELEKLKKIKMEHDLTYSAHFPISSIELASPNKFVRTASVKSLVHAYKSLKFLASDIEIFVLHPTGGFVANLLKLDVDPMLKKFVCNLFVRNAVQSVKEVIKETKIDKNKIAIENIEFPFEGTLEIIKQLKGPKLCIDTAHFLGGYSGEVNLVEIMEKYLDITCEIHLQDYSEEGFADHNALGRGEFPKEVLKIIHEQNFEGPIVFELTHEQAVESLEYIKKHAPEIEVPTIK